MIGITGLGETAAVNKVVASEVFDSVQTYVNAVNPSAGWAVEGEARGQNFDRLLDTIVGARRRRGRDSGAGGRRPDADADQRAARERRAIPRGERDHPGRHVRRPTWRGRSGSRRWPPSSAWKARPS